MNRGEVWRTNFEPATGSEIRKTRPAVMVSNDAANGHLARVVVVPMTSNTAHLYPGEALVTVVDKSCLKNQLGTLSRTDMHAVEKAIKMQLAL